MGPSKRDAWRDPRVAAEYEERRFRAPLQRIKGARDVRLVLATLRRIPGARRVLDLGCGTGRLLPAIREAGYEVVGADLSREMLAAGGRAGRALGLLQAEGERLPLASGSVDAVLVMRLLFHLSAAERATLLREAARVARLGVVGQVAVRETFKHAARSARARISASAPRPAQGRAEIARELSGAGLRLVTLHRLSLLFSDKALFLARPG